MKHILKKLANRLGRHETLDTTPDVSRVKFKKPPTLQENMEMMFARHRSRLAMDRLGAYQESREEMEDFDVPDSDYGVDPISRWETKIPVHNMTPERPPNEPAVPKETEVAAAGKKSKKISAAAQQQSEDSDDEQ